MDRTETSLSADIQSPWAGIPQSALDSTKSKHPPKNVAHNSVHRKRYPLEALVIMHENA